MHPAARGIAAAAEPSVTKSSYDAKLGTISNATAKPVTCHRRGRLRGPGAALKSTRASQQIDVQLDGVAAIDDVGNVDRGALVVDHDTTALRNRRAEFDLQ